MFKFQNNTFHVTRGDRGSITFSSSDGSNLKGILLFRVYRKEELNSQPVLNKEIELDNTAPSYVLNIDSIDTLNEFANPENERDEYWYELKVDEQTILGYDETGAKIFYLYPTGQDKISQE